MKGPCALRVWGGSVCKGLASSVAVCSGCHLEAAQTRNPPPQSRGRRAEFRAAMRLAPPEAARGPSAAPGSKLAVKLRSRGQRRVTGQVAEAAKGSEQRAQSHPHARGHRRTWSGASGAGRSWRPGFASGCAPACPGTTHRARTRHGRRQGDARAPRATSGGKEGLRLEHYP